MRALMLVLMLAAPAAQAQMDMSGLHWMRGDSMLMLHGWANFVYDDQGGPRGDDKVFSSSMFMLMGETPAAGGRVEGRAMLSLDPAMGAAGYPLLLQTGETADGVTPLVDRQHPHDFFMELSGTYTRPLGDGAWFLYGGLPGEPALGPPAFMHRASAGENPEAPLTHHWLDSTHITFGVVTFGAERGPWMAEASAFNGREPDENRWNIESRSLDSYSGRITYAASESWSLQVSHGYLASPEALEPEVAVHRTTASVALALGGWQTTLAAGINREGGDNHPGALLESAYKSGAMTYFGRADWLRSDHYTGADLAVAKLSLGASRRLLQAAGLDFSAGALGSAYAIPAALEPAYGSNPLSFMVFLRAAISE